MISTLLKFTDVILKSQLVGVTSARVAEVLTQAVLRGPTLQSTRNGSVREASLRGRVLKRPKILREEFHLIHPLVHAERGLDVLEQLEVG